MSTLPGANKVPSNDPHDNIEARLIMLFFGWVMFIGGTQLWVSIIGGICVAFAILRILWRDIYKALI